MKKTDDIEIIDFEEWAIPVDCNPAHIQNAVFAIIEYAIEGIKINMHDRELFESDRDIINRLLSRIDTLKQIMRPYHVSLLEQYDIPYLKMLASGVKVYSII